MEVLASMLKKFGLNTSEAKVYTALLILKDAKASEIAKRANVPRNKLYEIADSLNKKGFVEIIPEKIRKFRAVPFEEICEMHAGSLRHELDEIAKTKNEIIQRLKKISEPHDEKSYFAVLRSRKVIRKKVEEIMNSSDRTLLLINISDMRNLINITRKASKNTEVNVIAPLNKDNIALAKKWMRFAEIRHYETSVQEKVAITKDAVLIFELSSPLALYSNDAKFVSMFRSFWEAEWNVAMPSSEKIKEIETGKPADEIVLLRGRENLYSMLPGFFKEAKNDVIVITYKNGLARMHKHLGKHMEEAKARGVRIHVITTVTKDNMEYAKNIHAEIRHVDKVHAIAGCYDNNRLVMINTKSDTISKNSPDDTIMIVNNSDTVSMMRQMLESMWEHAVPLEERIAELETGKPHEETRYIYGRQKLYDMVPQLLEDTEHDVLWTTSETGLVRIYNNLKHVIDEHKNRVHIRCIAPITKSNIEIAKKLGIEIRHIDNVYALADCYDDSLAVIINPKDDDISNDEVMITNKRETVKMMRQMLESIWDHATPLEEREEDLSKKYTDKELIESIALEKMYEKAHEEKEV